jgi:phosphatidylinositol alpha-mannosyltransferase
MRIAVFSYGLPVAGEKRGGIERVAHVLAQGLKERGHETVVFTHDARPEGAIYEVRQLPWKAFVETWLGRRVTMGYLGNILALLPDYRPFDVVVAFGDSLLLPLTGKPVLRVMLGSALGEAMSARSPGRFVMQSGVYLQELAGAMLQRTVGISENTRRHNPFVRQSILLGVDARVFFPRPGDKTAEPSIIFVGAASGRKRGRFLLDIFASKVRPAFPSASLMFVGAAGEPAPGVTYHTGVSDAELASLYRRAWVYASPSTYEGFGLPYLEAMACGTAVIATPNPGSREVLVDGTYGWLPHDDDFGASINTLLADGGRRSALASSGLHRARELSLESMLDRYEALLAELCGSHAGSIASA